MAAPIWSRKHAPSTMASDAYARRRHSTIVLMTTFALGVAIVCIVTLSSRNSLLLTTATPTNNVVTSISTTTTTRGQLDDLFYHQGLSHVAFHSKPFKKRLAELVRLRNTVGVVGVEWGDEVEVLASAGFRVIAFEPLSHFHDALKLISTKRGWNVQLHKIAAGAESQGSVSLEYEKTRETVSKGRIADYINEELDVLSIDIQGNELDVLKGAKGVKARSLWIEIFPCNPKVNEILRLLDNDYVIFDFVPWGRLNTGAPPAALTEMEVAAEQGWLTRPSQHTRYLKWFCKLSDFGFRWMQSDIVAIRRDVLTPKIRAGLSTIGNDLLVALLEEETARRRQRSEARRRANSAV